MEEPRISTEEAAEALQLLSHGALKRQEGLSGYPTEALHSDSDEKTDSPCPIVDSFYHSGRSDGVMTMINLNIRQFNKLWEVEITEMDVAFFRGRGRKTPNSLKDILFMKLTVLKNGEYWDRTARLFKIQMSSFEHLVTKAIKSISDPFTKITLFLK